MELSEKFKQRFISRLKILGENRCWEWQGYLNEKGYGRISYKGSLYYAHRLSYVMANNHEFSSLDIVMHTCNNPKCCNPKHLQLGTIQENNEQKRVENRFYINPRKKRKKKFTEEQVMVIRLRLRNGHGTWNIASDTGASTQCIRDIKNWVTWKEVGIAPKKDFTYDPFADE